MSPIAAINSAVDGIKQSADGKGVVISTTAIIMALVFFVYEQNQQVQHLESIVAENTIILAAVRQWVNQSDRRAQRLSLQYDDDIMELKKLHGITEHTSLNIDDGQTLYELIFMIRGNN